MLQKLTRSLPIAILILFASCTRQYLDVETKYFSYSDLASVRVFSPDPKKLMENIPEQFLLIKWAIPQNQFQPEQFKLEIRVRFGNRDEEIFYYNIKSRAGTYHFTLDQNSYFEKKGIVTYQVQILESDKPFAKFAHPVWAEVLTIDEDQDE